MCDALFTVLTSVEGVNPPIFSCDDVSRWPAGDLERCIASGLVRPGRSATELSCPGCAESGEVLVLRDKVTGQSHAYVRCAQCGLAAVPWEFLQTWELTFTQLIDVLFAGIPFAGFRDEIVRNRVWCLGKKRWAGASRSDFFARALHRQDAWQVLHQAKLPVRSVVFVPTRLPNADARTDPLPTIVPPSAVVSCENRTLRFDEAYVEAEITGILARLDSEVADKRRPSPRGSRLKGRPVSCQPAAGCEELNRSCCRWHVASAMRACHRCRQIFRRRPDGALNSRMAKWRLCSKGWSERPCLPEME
jgi:predicted RNA-binding Zn-ribbon protein involved in translation (DUF1610 family)